VVGTVLAYALCTMAWGTSWYVIRLCIGPGGYATFDAAALRFVLAAVLFLPVLLSPRVRPLPRGAGQWSWLVGAGALNALGYGLVYAGEETVPGGLAAVLYATEPLMLAPLLLLTRTERVTRADLAGALVAFAGIVILFAERLEVSTEQAVGILLILCAVAVSAVYSVILKQHAASVHPFALTAVFLSVSAIGLSVAAAFEGAPLPDPLPLVPTLALVYLALVASIVAFGAYIFLLSRARLMTAMTLVFVLPVIALVVDAFFEREVRLTSRSYAGVAVTLSGVVFSALQKSRGAEPSAELDAVSGA
jgi:drug/metabolite transporter (DMT)-like permease